MKNIKQLVMVACFAVLAACGGNDADKFVGKWADPAPKKQADADTWPPLNNFSNDIVIKANGSNEVEITANILGSEKKNIYTVDGDNILSSSKRVLYTLKGVELVKSGSDVKLIRQ